jgi:hypothetical protein
MVPWEDMNHDYLPQERDETHHAETHAFIAVDEIAEILGSGCNRYPFPVPQLVQTALDAKVRFPVLTISYARV